MSEILEILKYVLPSLVVFASSYFLLKQFMESDQRKRMIEMKMMNKADNQQFVTPIRLQAYERIVLFLERISPNSLVLRVSEPQMNVLQLQTALIFSIRQEYEHNLSQQLYVSSKAWQIVKDAKEDLINVISSIAANIDKTADSSELAKAIFELTSAVEKMPVEIAIEILKNEIQEQF
ncbi:MAG: hypothetical protein HXX18_04690 [Bacteroidetes bacterium]|nr:hypothetical protein [Bacteroidota bacterium]